MGAQGKAGKGLHHFTAVGEWRRPGGSPRRKCLVYWEWGLCLGRGGTLSPWGANCCCFNLYDQVELGRIMYWPTQTGHLHFWDRILKELLNTASNKAHNDIFLYAEPWELNWGRHSLFFLILLPYGLQPITATEAKERWGRIRIWRLTHQGPSEGELCWFCPVTAPGQGGSADCLPGLRAGATLTLIDPIRKKAHLSETPANMRSKAQKIHVLRLACFG